MKAVRTAISQSLRAAWRRRWLGVAVAWLVCGLGWTATYTIPGVYQTSTRLFIEEDALPGPDFIERATGRPISMPPEEIVRRALLSRPGLGRAIAETRLRFMQTGPWDWGRLIERLNTDI